MSRSAKDKNDTIHEERRIMLATELAHNDDFLSSLLIDSLGTLPDTFMGVHYQQPDYEKRRPVTLDENGEKDTDAVLRILRDTVVKGDVSEGVRRIAELPVVHDYLEKFDSVRIKTFVTHLKRYVSLYSPTTRVEITLTNRYSFVTGHPELAIHATRNLYPGETLDALRHFQPVEEDEDYLVAHFGNGGQQQKRRERGGDPVLYELAGGLERLPRCWREEIGDFTDIEDSSEDSVSEDELSDGVEREEDESVREQRDAAKEEKRKKREVKEKEKEKRRRAREAKRKKQKHGGKEKLDAVFGKGSSTGVVGNERIKMRDFSVVDSSRGGTMLFLGPGRFLNHDCSPNVKLHSPSTKLMMFKVIKPVKVGEELCSYYGPDYFGPGNRECLCLTCENNQEGGFTPEEMDETTTDKDSDAPLPSPSPASATFPSIGSSSSPDGNSRASSLLRTPRKGGAEASAHSPHGTPSRSRSGQSTSEAGGDSPSRPRRVVAEQAMVKTSQMYENPWQDAAMFKKQEERQKRSARVGTLMQRDRESRNGGDSVSGRPVEEEVEDAPGTIRCWACLMVVETPVVLQGAELHLCIRCFRHQRIYRHPWPARVRDQVLVYPPKHMRPTWWEPPLLSERLALPIFRSAKSLMPADPASILATANRNSEEERLARDSKNAAKNEYIARRVARQFEEAREAAQRELVRIAKEEAIRAEANRAKEEEEARKAKMNKGSGQWRRWEWEEVEDEPDPALILPAGQTRRGRIFKEANPVAKDLRNAEADVPASRVSARTRGKKAEPPKAISEEAESEGETPDVEEEGESGDEGDEGEADDEDDEEEEEEASDEDDEDQEASPPPSLRRSTRDKGKAPVRPTRASTRRVAPATSLIRRSYSVISTSTKDGNASIVGPSRTVSGPAAFRSPSNEVNVVPHLEVEDEDMEVTVQDDQAIASPVSKRLALAIIPESEPEIENGNEEEVDDAPQSEVLPSEPSSSSSSTAEAQPAEEIDKLPVDKRIAVAVEEVLKDDVQFVKAVPATHFPVPDESDVDEVSDRSDSDIEMEETTPKSLFKKGVTIPNHTIKNDDEDGNAVAGPSKPRTPSKKRKATRSPSITPKGKGTSKDMEIAMGVDSRPIFVSSEGESVIENLQTPRKRSKRESITSSPSKKDYPRAHDLIDLTSDVDLPLPPKEIADPIAKFDEEGVVWLAKAPPPPPPRGQGTRAMKNLLKTQQQAQAEPSLLARVAGASSSRVKQDQEGGKDAKVSPPAQANPVPAPAHRSPSASPSRLSLLNPSAPKSPAQLAAAAQGLSIVPTQEISSDSDSATAAFEAAHRKRKEMARKGTGVLNPIELEEVAEGIAEGGGGKRRKEGSGNGKEREEEMPIAGPSQPGPSSSKRKARSASPIAKSEPGPSSSRGDVPPPSKKAKPSAPLAGEIGDCAAFPVDLTFLLDELTDEEEEVDEIMNMDSRSGTTDSGAGAAGSPAFEHRALPGNVPARRSRYVQ